MRSAGASGRDPVASHWSTSITPDREGVFPPSPSRHARLGALFERALELPRERRAAFVREACGDDEALRDDLTSLLDAHESARDYFDDLSASVLVPALSVIAGPADEVSGADLADALRTKLAGTYLIERELAGGGMSRVFVAEDVRLKRRVVIKALPPEMAPAASAERFRREIELAAQLQHPHIVPVLAADSADGILYYTMPFVTGESLSDRLSREGALPVGEALGIWRDVLDALAHAHAHGVIHRDIKPGNVLLSGRHALVTDFGIASAIETAAGDDARPPAGLVIGTPAYMAPEATGEETEADHRADIYAAGLVMYEMLAGRPPFVADSAHAYLLAHRTREPHRLRSPNVPRELADLVVRCLAKDPADRPQSADTILAERLVRATEEVLRPISDGADRWRRVVPYVVIALALGAAVFATVRFRPGSPGPVDARAPDIAAYEWYVRGMDVALLRTDSGRRQGVAYFERAIDIDSTYVDAWAGLALMYVGLSNAAPGGTRDELLERARRAALTAVGLDDDDADARAALGWVHVLTRDYRAARAEFERAIALDPRVPRGHEGLARVHMMMGRPVEQLAAARLGVEADPFSHSAIRELALALATNGRCGESLEQLRALKALTPPAGVAGVLRGLCYASREKWPEAIAEFRWAAEHGATAAPAFLGYTLARAGQREEAAGILADLVGGRRYSHGAFGVATVHAGLGEYERAFAWLERAIDERTMSFYIMHPMFGELHRDPRFEQLRERMGVSRRSGGRR